MLVLTIRILTKHWKLNWSQAETTIQRYDGDDDNDGLSHSFSESTDRESTQIKWTQYSWTIDNNCYVGISFPGWIIMAIGDCCITMIILNDIQWDEMISCHCYFVEMLPFLLTFYSLNVKIQWKCIIISYYEYIAHNLKLNWSIHFIQNEYFEIIYHNIHLKSINHWIESDWWF